VPERVAVSVRVTSSAKDRASGSGSRPSIIVSLAASLIIWLLRR